MAWIAKRIREANAAAPVLDAVISVLKLRLEGDLRQTSLRPAELNELARELISAADASNPEATS
jgi:hypothetical protein